MCQDRRRLSRGAFLVFLAQVPQGTVVMVACGSAHYWGRRIQELGHEVVLLPPHQVRPYVTRNKTDRTDAKGILEAYRNADIHRTWAFALERWAKHNKAAVALADKLARIAWAVWKRGRDFEARPKAA